MRRRDQRSPSEGQLGHLEGELAKALLPGLLMHLLDELLEALGV